MSGATTGSAAAAPLTCTCAGFARSSRRVPPSRDIFLLCVELVTSSSDSTVARARTALIRVAASYAAIAIAGVILLALVGIQAWALAVVVIAAILACSALTWAVFTSRLKRIGSINQAAE